MSSPCVAGEEGSCVHGPRTQAGEKGTALLYMYSMWMALSKADPKPRSRLELRHVVAVTRPSLRPAEGLSQE